MSTLLAGLVSGYGAWKTFRWLLPRNANSAKELDALGPEEWLRQTDLVIMLFTLEFYLQKNKKKPVVQKLAEQVKKVDNIMGKLQEILRWKNDGWRWAYRSWAWTGEEKLFEQLKVEYAILQKRIELLKTLEK